MKQEQMDEQGFYLRENIEGSNFFRGKNKSVCCSGQQTLLFADDEVENGGAAIFIQDIFVVMGFGVVCLGMLDGLTKNLAAK